MAMPENQHFLASMLRLGQVLMGKVGINLSVFLKKAS